MPTNVQANGLELIGGKRKLRSEPPTMPTVRREIEYRFSQGASLAYLGNKTGARVVAMESVIRDLVRRQNARILELEARQIGICMRRAA